MCILSICSRMAILPVVMTLTACGLSGPPHGPPMANASAVIDMGLSSYSPAKVTIRAGEIVERRNTSVITHTVTDNPGHAEKREDEALPPSAQAFNSGDIPAGQVFTRRFTVPGTYRYFCSYHKNAGMVGAIVVMASPS